MAKWEQISETIEAVRRQRESVREATLETDKTLARIDALEVAYYIVSDRGIGTRSGVPLRRHI